MKKLIRLAAVALLTCLSLAPAIFAQGNPTNTPVPSNAKETLEKLKTLAGSWQGEIMGIKIEFTIRAVSSGTAVIHEGHTEGGGPPNHEVTMFYIEGGRLLATHYCDAGNQSRMEGKMSPDEKAIKFSFLEVVGSKRGGYMKDLALTLLDSSKHLVEVSFVTPDGKEIPLRGEFKRTK